MSTVDLSKNCGHGVSLGIHCSACAKLFAQLDKIQDVEARITAAVAAEREACAKACDKLARSESPTAPNLADDCAEAIRARGVR